MAAFTAYCDHEATKPYLSEYEISQSLVGTEYWLILDRQDDRAYVALAAKTQQFLGDQYLLQKPSNREIEEASQEFQRSVRALVSIEENAAAASLKSLDEKSKLVAQMLAFLDEWYIDFGPPFS